MHRSSRGRRGAVGGTTQAPSDPDPAGAHTGWRARWRPLWRRHRRDMVVVGLYVAVAVFAYWRLWTGSGTVTGAPGTSDPALNMWFLTYAPFALLHGQNLLHSSWANVPWGVNLVTNTGEQAPGLLAAPLTLLAGPSATWVALCTFALASSASAAYALARRWTSWRGAAFAGGLLYGFSPYMVAHGAVHLNLILVPLPPLIVLVLDQLLVRRRGRPEVLGFVLGALVVVQFFISTEVLTTTVIVCVVGLAMAAAVAPSQVQPSLGPLLRCGAVAAVVSGALLAYPVWFGLHGPAHIAGPIQPIPQAYRADLAGTVVPSRLQAIVPGWAATMSASFMSGDVTENGSYLGLPLVVVLVGATVVLWRRRSVRVVALTLLACWLLSLGARLTVTGEPSPKGTGGVPLPDALLAHVPVASNLIPSRFTLYVGLGAGMLLALATDALFGRVRRGAAPRWLRTGLVAVVPVAALVPLVPAWPYPSTTIATPSFFTTSAVDAVPQGATVLTYPFPFVHVDDAAPMVWQADSFFRFRMVGGYFLVPQANGQVGTGRPTSTSGALDDVYEGDPPARSATLHAVVRAQLRRWGVSVVLADESGDAGRRGVSFLEWLIGRRPVSSHGVAAWYHVDFATR